MKTKNFKHLCLLLFITMNIISFAQSNNIELYMLRKGTDINLSIAFLGGDFPKEIIIKRKSDAPLSKYRKIVTVSDDDLLLLKEKGKLLLKDNYPESRKFDAYYKIITTANDDVIIANPPILLPKSSPYESVTFGDHKKDASLFEEREEIITYEMMGIKFQAERGYTTVFLNTAVQSNNIKGDWFIERKTSKPLSSFRRIKVLTEEDKKLIMAGDHKLIDKYPESRKLDSYYRITILNEEGKKIIFPSILLARDPVR